MLKLLMPIVVTASLLSSSVSPTCPGDRVTGLPFATRSEVIAPEAMAATSHPLATNIALEIMRAGGNAIDAAIAANAALGLMEPTGSGIGGDLFAIVWDAKGKKLHGLNASGRSAAGLNLAGMQAELDKRGQTLIPSKGALPVTVPGCVDGWFELHARFGNLPMSDLLAPAAGYARRGFPVTELIAHYWQMSVRTLGEQPGFLDTFAKEGRGPERGEMWTNPQLAATLERLGRDGRDVFYKGDFAKTMVDCLQRAGGAHTLADFANHTSEWVEPVSTDYRGYTLWELPPNGQGIAALQILNLLEGYDIQGMGFGSAEYVHHFVEAKKLAFADRSRLYADPSFTDLPVDELISKEYAGNRRKLIDPMKAALEVEPGLALPAALEEGDTIYLTVADGEGNMVSLIQSNYRGMGSGLCPPELGFGFQDRGELFDMTPGRSNSYEPSKRPFHTIIPAFVTKEGQPLISYGVMGGATQPQAHAQVLINLVDFGMNLQEAGDAPRILHTGSSQPTGQIMIDGGYVSLESGFSEEVRADLAKRGHQFRSKPGAFGGYQAIRYDAEKGVYFGASESRKDGHAAGY